MGDWSGALSCGNVPGPSSCGGGPRGRVPSVPRLVDPEQVDVPVQVQLHVGRRHAGEPPEVALEPGHMLLAISIASRQAGSRRSSLWASEARPLSAMAPLRARSRSWTTAECVLSSRTEQDHFLVNINSARHRQRLGELDLGHPGPLLRALGRSLPQSRQAVCLAASRRRLARPPSRRLPPAAFYCPTACGLLMFTKKWS